MAIFHLSVKPICRSAGRSSTAAAAYRSACRIVDRRTGEIHDYRRRKGVESSQIILPTDGAKWAMDRSKLWNAAEAAEKRKDACTAREIVLALPFELSPDERQKLALDFATEMVSEEKCAVDIAIHSPSLNGDDRNYHAHILRTTRRLGVEGFGEKLDTEKSGRNRVADLHALRELWSKMVNHFLQTKGVDARVDHRSLQAQGIEREPTTHAGPARTAFKRRQARRPHMIEETTKLTPGQERLAKQLVTLKARLARTDLSRFNKTVIETEKGEPGEKISTFER